MGHPALDYFFASETQILIAAYFDESFDSNRKKVFVAGGFLGRNSAWFHLEHRWNQLLQKYELPYYRAVDCEHGRGVFEKYRTHHHGHLLVEDRKQLSLIRHEFIDAILAGKDIAGFAVGIDLRAFADVCDSESKLEAFGGTPFYYGYHLTMLDAALEVNRFYGGMVAFVGDRHEEYSSLMVRTHDNLKTANPDLRHTLGPIMFEDKRQYIGLQVADLFIYEVKRWLETRFDQSEHGEREEMRRLREGPVVAKIDICSKACLEDYLRDRGLL